MIVYRGIIQFMTLFYRVFSHIPSKDLQHCRNVWKVAYSSNPDIICCDITANPNHNDNNAERIASSVHLHIDCERTTNSPIGRYPYRWRTYRSGCPVSKATSLSSSFLVTAAGGGCGRACEIGRDSHREHDSRYDARRYRSFDIILLTSRSTLI